MSHHVCHIEFNSTDLERSQAFYAQIFDWKFAAYGPEMVVFGTDAGHIGGLIKTDKVGAGDSPSVWFEVESVEETLGKALAAGGAVRSPKSPVPGVGWSGAFTDPDGNAVGLVEYSAER
ncbi:MAG: VOC family protein [Fimbriimonadaceae bacterium]|nr:VOC family protein [Chthonomonadaceae bacterium]MCO5296566.1 VOC family protein [Fimbriimonadaceae bacterium]